MPPTPSVLQLQKTNEVAGENLTTAQTIASVAESIDRRLEALPGQSAGCDIIAILTWVTVESSWS